MRRISGVSLIELMVALAIGSLLVLGLVEVFSASRTAYQLSEGLSRVQENSRFAMDYIQRDFRMGGHMGCVNDQSRFLPENAIGPRSPLASTFLTASDQLNEVYGGTGAYVPDALRFDLPVQGYEANGTGAGSTVALTAMPVINNSAAGWTPQIPALLNTALSNRVENSDVLVLRQFSPRGAQVTSFTPGDPAVIEVPMAQFANLTEDQASPGLFGIADCMSAGVFSATATNAGSDPATITVSASGANLSSMAGSEPYVAGQAFVYVAQTIVYYVGLTNPPAPAPRVPALYRLRYTMAPGAAAPTFVNEELVEGIERMQLQYGVDSFVAGRPSGNMGTTVLAGSVTDWRRVGAVQVGLVARSSNPAAATQRVTNLSALGVTFTTTAADDGRFRTTYENTIAMRNRLFGH